MRIALAQLNLYVGDMDGNARKIVRAMRRARQRRAHLLATPELGITGYPPEDLLHRKDFIDANLATLNRVVRVSRKLRRLTTIVGYVDRVDRKLYNAAALIRDGRIAGRYYKQVLPNYGVFDEMRYFKPGENSPVFYINGTPVGITICEDLWEPDGPPARALKGSGVSAIISINASPYEIGKLKSRESLMARHARESGAMLYYLNAIGAQDELVFDGSSMVLDRKGKVVERGHAFEEDFLVLDSARNYPPARRKPPAELLEVYYALVLGVKEYARKNGFESAMLGLSGGVDSALTAAIAVDALGNRRVTGVIMPSRFTSKASLEDARELAKRLKIRCLELPIEQTMSAYLAVLGRHVAGPAGDVARQNLQARIRGAFLMALSNRYGSLVLTTGNKSEMSVGYATLYGDMAGGFAVLKDVPKTYVYRLARWHSEGPTGAIPRRILTKAPSAELKPNQKDTDSLPPYRVLDPILRLYLEEAMSLKEIVQAGLPRSQVRRTAKLVDGSEYKRRQAPPGVKIGPRAFGRDRRVPISHGFKPWEKG